MNTKCVCCAAAARMSYTVFLHSNVLFLRSNVVSLRSSVSSLPTSVLSLQRSVLRRKMLRRHTMLRREKLLSTTNNVFLECAVIRHGWQETTLRCHKHPNIYNLDHRVNRYSWTLSFIWLNVFFSLFVLERTSTLSKS